MRRAEPDWADWLRRWDAQQESFNPERERRFSAMLDILEAELGPRFTALDLGSGPGSLSARLLRRFPRARAVAVDYDPVVRRIGEGALGNVGGRLTWVDAKLGRRGWAAGLPPGRFDAAVSTTALHWLARGDLARLYVDLGARLRPGGVLLNGDFLPWGKRDAALSRLAEKVRKVRFPKGGTSAEWGTWRQWWRDARREPALRAAFAEHRRRGASHPTRRHAPLDLHLRLLSDAGFRHAGVVWEDLENRILYARR